MTKAILLAFTVATSLAAGSALYAQGGQSPGDTPATPDRPRAGSRMMGGDMMTSNAGNDRDLQQDDVGDARQLARAISARPQRLEARSRFLAIPSSFKTHSWNRIFPGAGAASCSLRTFPCVLKERTSSDVR